MTKGLEGGNGPGLPNTLLLTHSEGDINTIGEGESFPFEIVLDSGAVDHVADSTEALGYSIDSSGKSTASFAAAN